MSKKKFIELDKNGKQPEITNEEKSKTISAIEVDLTSVNSYQDWPSDKIMNFARELMRYAKTKI